MRNAREAGYSTPARWLHWLTALCVFILVPVAVAMTNLGEGALTNALYEIHKSVGVIAFAIVVVRLAYRLLRGAPPSESGLTPFERVVSRWTHRALYAIVFVMPILGYAGTSMCCAPINLFWTIPIPITVTGSEEATKRILSIHQALGFALTGLVALHIAGASYHALIKRDGVLRRMLPSA
ncbi:cytochrome b [Alsobacter sp. KACC 23698]|uniref:Cytochrome b n=1 Tax=Alsobacter sp. KACC 23698 TaxID=3149229 RepID=A0AAU7J9N1_9HYPH